MIKNILKLLCFFVLAQTNAQAPTEKSLLWKISGNGLKTSYLFGTMHATCDAALSPKVKEGLDNTQQLYLELDMDDPSLQLQMMKGVNMKNGTKMSELATESDFAAVDTFIKENVGISIKSMNTMKPFFVSSLLITKMLDCPMQSIEQELMKAATGNNKQVFGLETVDEQMGVFDAIPYQDQMNELIKTAKNGMVDDKKEFQQLYSLYLQQDLNGMLAMSKESKNSMSSKFENELLSQRNANWIPRIEKVAIEKPTFFAVGAAHLGGDGGVIALLRKKGYKVEAVK
ncbi:MAG: TraB/GumN family protein [Flavobacterium sp. BFFFF1]|uniref:TraB/GumN family protein n=1 Tax=Flavobacterium sp. BFFFF1 TaxID=2015557 RepID=UPI000BD4246D|nr:TraB/GumN family protein [Flavobacterium sp. BFFFF1]OYU81900.1 MAG: TraB/GumN family protein [Flavobacterium sp. BFFFF1]